MEAFGATFIAWLANHLSLGVKALVAFFGAGVERRLPAFRTPPVSTSAAWRRIAGNVSLFVLWSLVVAAFSATVVGWVSKSGIAGYGLLRRVSLPSFVALPFSLLVLDATNYVVHRLEHALPYLWRFHRVHHSDPHLDFSSTIRKHPLCAVYTSTFFLVVIVAVGIAPETVFIYNVGADVVGFLAHSNFRFPPAVSRFLQRLRVIAPDDHRIHHSEYQPETDSNFGQVFSVWDRLGGTYRTRADYSMFRYGLGPASAPERQTFGELLKAPIR
jgi:sterol desaturase/sphingolipid hydroxylase (fatty acid hydroxylase superfamily)